MKKYKALFQENKKSAFLALAALILPVIGSSVSVFLLFKYEQQWAELKEFEIVFFAVTAFTMAFLLTPTTFIASLSGFLFGLKSIFYIVPAYIIASSIGYFISKQFDEGKLMNTIGVIDQKQVLKNTTQDSPFWFVILCRISPVLPFGLMNVVLPAFGITYKEFQLAGTIGMLPRTMLFIWIGATANNVIEAVQGEEGLGMKFYITSALVVLSCVGLIFMFKRKVK